MTIRVSGLRHEYGDLAVLDGLELTVDADEFVSIVGPSGCGKSTLLRVLAGVLTPAGGLAEVAGKSTIGRPGLVGFMPQRDLLLPWRRALDNAVLGAEIAGAPRDAARARAQDLFPQFGLAGFEAAWPTQLSGGMRQRLALLRTFLIDSDVLLLDEPFGALDAITRREMYEWLQEVWLTDQRTVLFVTHDVDEAIYLSDRVLVCTPRPGRIHAEIPVDLPRPREPKLLTDPDFVARKADVLAALESVG